MIKKTGKGYEVVSRKGKVMTRRDLTLGQAKERLREIEAFKHIKGGKKG